MVLITDGEDHDDRAVCSELETCAGFNCRRFINALAIDVCAVRRFTINEHESALLLPQFGVMARDHWIPVKVERDLANMWVAPDLDGLRVERTRH